jgi:hypothetical protein
LPLAACIIDWTSSWAHSANCTGSSSTGHGACSNDGWEIKTIIADIKTNL